MAETEVKPPEQQTKEELAASIAAEQARLAEGATEEVETPQPEPKQAKPSYKAADGTVYEADTSEELFKKVTAALDNTKTALKDRERALYEARNVKPAEVKPAAADAAFDKQKWIQMLEEDPIKAQDYLDRYRFGMDPDEIKRTIAQSKVREQAAVQSEELQKEVVMFYQSPAGQAYAKVETPELNTMLLQYMDEQGIPRTHAGFRAAFYEMRDANLIPAENEEKPKRKVPPRSATGGGGNSQQAEPDEAFFRSMSKKELADWAAKNGITVPNYGR